MLLAHENNVKISRYFVQIIAQFHVLFKI